jgi:hypothetical protein
VKRKIGTRMQNLKFLIRKTEDDEDQLWKVLSKRWKVRGKRKKTEDGPRHQWCLDDNPNLRTKGEKRLKGEDLEAKNQGNRGKWQKHFQKK